MTVGLTGSETRPVLPFGPQGAVKTDFCPKSRLSQQDFVSEPGLSAGTVTAPGAAEGASPMESAAASPFSCPLSSPWGSFSLIFFLSHHGSWEAFHFILRRCSS